MAPSETHVCRQSMLDLQLERLNQPLLLVLLQSIRLMSLLLKCQRDSLRLVAVNVLARMLSESECSC